MTIGVMEVRLAIREARDLKAKRRILKGLKDRIRQEFNVSIAEVDDNDLWQSAVLGVVCVSNDSKYAHGLLSKVVNWLEQSHYDIEIVEYDITLC